MRFLLVAAACAVANAVPGLAPGRAAAAAAPSVRVDGAHLVDGTGAPLRLAGVDRSGTEYACIQGWGIFDGPSDAASVAAMASWRINAVRVPLNEDCWLGINGVSSQYGGAAYRAAVLQYVQLLHSYGLVAILDLHWTAPGTQQATGQMPLPDADHAPAFWSSVASTFAGDPGVIFDLFNEPFVDTSNAQTSDPWSCWLNGCTVDAGDGAGAPWQAAGMQSLVNAVRGAGATQPIMLGGLAWSSDESGWLAHEPVDPDGQLVASLHEYNFGGCSTASCWTGVIAPLSRQVPVVTGELGENDCAGRFIDSYLQWADANDISYLAWTWDTWDCASGPALISDYSGTPTAFGAAYRAHLAELPAEPLLVTAPDPVVAAPAAVAATAASDVAPSPRRHGSDAGTATATHRAAAVVVHGNPWDRRR